MIAGFEQLAQYVVFIVSYSHVDGTVNGFAIELMLKLNSVLAWLVRKYKPGGEPAEKKQRAGS